MNKIPTVKIGRQKSSGKFFGQLTLADGSSFFTPPFDTYEECKMVIDEWLQENNATYEFHKLN